MVRKRKTSRSSISANVKTTVSAYLFSKYLNVLFAFVDALTNRRSWSGLTFIDFDARWA